MTRAGNTPLALFLLLAATIAIFFPVYGAFVDTASDDFTVVSRYAERLAGGAGIASPHFLFPLLVVGVQKAVSSLSFLEATRVACLGAQLLTAIILFFVFRQAAPSRSAVAPFGVALLVLVTLLLGPINLWTVSQHNLYAGYFNPTNFHNPSSNLLKPFAVVLFFAFTASLGAAARQPWPMVINLSMVHTAAMLVKPSFSIYFIPAMALVAVAAWAWRWPLDLRLIAVAYLLPFLLIVAAQYFVTYTPAHAGEVQRYVALDPLRVVLKSTPAIGIPVKAVASIAFPLTVLGAFFRQAKKNRELFAAWAGFLVAAAYAYLLVEGVAGTEQWSDGNFWWSVQIATFLLFVVSIRHVLFCAGAERGWRPSAALGAKLWGSALILAAHLCGGILWYLATLRHVTGVWR